MALKTLSVNCFRKFKRLQLTFQVVSMIKKRQLVVEEGNEGRTAAALFYSLAA